MAHQMKNLCGFSVFPCVEGAFCASSGGTPKMKNGAPRDEPKNGRGRGLILHRHILAIPHFAMYRAMIVRYPTKTSTKKFCDTIATSIARYEKYRCWASKLPFQAPTSLEKKGNEAQTIKKIH